MFNVAIILLNLNSVFSFLKHFGLCPVWPVARFWLDLLLTSDLEFKETWALMLSMLLVVYWAHTGYDTWGIYALQDNTSSAYIQIHIRLCVWKFSENYEVLFKCKGTDGIWDPLAKSNIYSLPHQRSVYSRRMNIGPRVSILALLLPHFVTLRSLKDLGFPIFEMKGLNEPLNCF